MALSGRWKCHENVPNSEEICYLIVFGEIEFFAAVLAAILNVAGMGLFMHGQCALVAVAFIALGAFVVLAGFLEVIGKDAVLLQYCCHFQLDARFGIGRCTWSYVNKLCGHGCANTNDQLMCTRWLSALLRFLRD